MADGREATATATTMKDTATMVASKTKKTTLLSLLRAKSERRAEAEEKVEWVRSQIIGGDAELDTPFGRRALVYADHTASGRGLRYVEDYLLTHVLPFYGNTHTEDSYVGSRTTRTLCGASNYIKRRTGAGDGVALLFCGSGTTAAIKRLQEATGIAAPPGLPRARVVALRPEERWVVFVGPYEHHSNLLSWRQSLADVVEVGAGGGEDGGGLVVDLAALRRALGSPEYADRPMLGSFSACSNVTGILTDTRAIARVLHQHGAFACFDFAASAPYVEIDMRPGEMDGYDAIFLSPHKFPGGAPGTPGILLMSRALYVLGARSMPPSPCGSATVSYVNGANECDTVYLDGMEEHEAAGRRLWPRRCAPLSRSGSRSGSSGSVLLPFGSVPTPMPPCVGSCGTPASRCLGMLRQEVAHLLLPRLPRRWRWSHGDGEEDKTTAPPWAVRGEANERPLRHPGQGWVRVCWPVRARAPRHWPRPLPPHPLRHSQRLPWREAGMDEGELRLLHAEGRVPVHPRHHRLRRRARPPLPAALRLRLGHGELDLPAPSGQAPPHHGGAAASWWR